MLILFEDSNWLVIEKPPGISTHGAWAGDLGAQEWLALHHDSPTFVISRLDKETSGVLVFAKNKASSAEAERIHQNGLAAKRYHLIVTPQQPLTSSEWIITTPLDGKSARTEFRVIEEWASRCVLVEATLTSGRMHQIRRHAAESRLPILGDTEYGGAPFDRLCLHCSETLWPGLPVLRSPLPESFQALKNFGTASPRNTPPHGSLITRFQAALDRRRGALTSVTDAYRLVHRKELGVDFALDRFGDYFVAWLYDEAARKDLLGLLETCVETQSFKGGAIKSLHSNPHKRGALCETQWMGDRPPVPFQVTEHNLRYHVALGAHDQTGFFLDQRDNRQIVRKKSKDKEVANLFAYTCSFSVAAAAGDCAQVTSVDVSKTALGDGIQNIRINGLEESRKAKIVQEDVRTWLKKQIRKGRQFDLVICDPPTFASRSPGSGPFQIEREWSLLAQDIHAILRPGGEALFCTNSRSMPTESASETLSACFSSNIRYRTPLDFPESVDPVHNRFFWVKKGL